VESVREALTTNTRGPISLEALADRIEAPPEKLRPLVDNQYLRVLMPSEQFEQTVVACPGQRATEWLKSMFQPLKMRPFIPLNEVGRLWRITERKVMRLCGTYKIPVQSDPVFGELMSFGALKRFNRARRKYQGTRFDRAALLRYYLSEIERVPWKKPPNYSDRLEIEIYRIARLKEPWKTIRSVYLIEAFRDARTVTECLRRVRERSGELAKSEKLIDDLLDRLLGPEMAQRTRNRAGADGSPCQADQSCGESVGR
jgi:hypothetical protein